MTGISEELIKRSSEILEFHGHRIGFLQGFIYYTPPLQTVNTPKIRAAYQTLLSALSKGANGLDVAPPFFI